MKCKCNVSPFMAIPEGDLSGFTGKQLRSYANAHSLSPTGESGEGWASWRNTANPSALLAAVVAHRDGTVLATTPTNMGLSEQDAEVLPELIKEISTLLVSVNPATVSALITSEVDVQLRKMRDQVQTFQVQVGNNPSSGPVFDLVHKQFKPLVRVLATNTHCMLVGGAGSGKTEGAIMAARALNREFELISVGPQTLQSELAGYRTATGEYLASAARRAFEGGKVLIIDELDAGNPGVFTFLNSTLSNAMAGYPDGVVARGPGFVTVACANTFGTGADMVYVGRSQQDGASLDRYVMLDWDYDNDLERHLALQHNAEAEAWVTQVQKWRTNMMKHKIRHVISPRASINGAKLLAAGFDVEEVAKMTVFKGLNKEAVDKIRQGA